MTSKLIADLKAATTSANGEGHELAATGTQEQKDVTMTYVRECMRALANLQAQLERGKDVSQRAKSIVDQVTRGG